MHDKKLKKLESLDGIDSVLIFNNDPNLFYFTNTNEGIFLYDFSKPKIIATKFDFLQARKSWIKNIEIVNDNALKELLKSLIVGIIVK